MPNPKLGKVLPDVTVQLVKSFYEDDECSHIIFGKKDYVRKMFTCKNVCCYVI